MGRDPAEPPIPGLLSTDGVKAAASKSPTVDATKVAAEIAPQRHILPKNLRHALTQLSDGELDELFEAAFDEAKRRGRLPQSVRTDVTPSAVRPSELTTKRLPQTDKRRRADIAEVSLTRGQVNVQFAPRSKLASLRRELPGSSGFPSRMYERRWRLIRRREYLCRG